ncbi:hypothetical protein VTH06DRAFT_1583, partial [Thermothelomyces fergusii]
MDSFMCPCTACFAATRGHPAVVVPQQHHNRHYYLRPNLDFFREKKGWMFGRLRRTRTVESTASTVLTQTSSPSAAREDEIVGGRNTREGEEKEEEEDGWADGSGPALASRSVWLSDEERVRIAFRRARAGAEKIGLDRSPFFPRTAAEYVGLKADMLAARAARLRAKVRERERVLRARTAGRWKRLSVVGRSGEIEEVMVPVYFGDSEDGRPAPRQSRARSTPGGLAGSNTEDRVVFKGKSPEAWGATPLQRVDEEVPGRWGDRADPALQSGFSMGSLLSAGPASAATGRRRTSSVTLLREVAAHAASRRGNLQGSGVPIPAHGPSPDRSPFEDDGSDSDSSFTPSDYRPGARRLTNTTRRAWTESSEDELGSSPGSSFTPARCVTTNLARLAETGGKGSTRGERIGAIDSSQERARGGADGSRSFRSALDDTLGPYNFQMYRTPSGTMETTQTDAAEREPGRVGSGPAQTQNNMRDDAEETTNDAGTDATDSLQDDDDDDDTHQHRRAPDARSTDLLPPALLPPLTSRTADAGGGPAGDAGAQRARRAHGRVRAARQPVHGGGGAG